MQGYSNLTLIGNLANEGRMTLPGGVSIFSTAIAINKKHKGQNDVFFMDVKIFGKLAVSLAPYLKKGTQVMFSGELVQESWEDKATHEKKTKFVLIAGQALLLGNKSPSEGENSEQKCYENDCPF